MRTISSEFGVSAFRTRCLRISGNRVELRGWVVIGARVLLEVHAGGHGARNGVGAVAGRIALAAEAKRSKTAFGVANLSDDLRNSSVHIFVDPEKPPSRDWGGGIPLPAPIDRLVLRSKADPASVVEPQTIITEDVTWDDRTGIMYTVGADGRPEKRPLTVKRSRATATFATGSIATLRAGDLEIVLTTAAGERRCSIPAKDRLRLLS